MSCAKHVETFEERCLRCQLGQLKAQLMMRTNRVAALEEALRLAEAKLCRAEMNLERRTEDAQKFATERDSMIEARRELGAALEQIAVIVEVPRGMMMQKIREVLEEVGFW